jgi:hypothetical protein
MRTIYAVGAARGKWEIGENMPQDWRSTIARHHFQMCFANSCGGMNWNLTHDICGTDSTLSELMKNFGSFAPG